MLKFKLKWCVEDVECTRADLKVYKTSRMQGIFGQDFDNSDK